MDFKPLPPTALPDLDMVFVKGGTFAMGDDRGDLHGSCRPIHQVQLDSFYMSKYPVTRDLWQAVMNADSSDAKGKTSWWKRTRSAISAYFDTSNKGIPPIAIKGDKRPMRSVSWEDTQQFIKKLNGISEVTFRLPTDAEWEYAARGGVLSDGYLYAGSDKLRQVGWYEGNNNEETRAVGQLRPNELGLHDMSGNVWEWCEDWWSTEYYAQCHQQGLVENPCNLTTGTDRVVRGGSCFDEAADCRCSLRIGHRPGDRLDGIGFRLVGVLQSVG
ncbi:MAG: SUMF1/EgtB/PvdO family nonheme iron enzyme [Bacteroidota bacterium]